MHGDLLLNFQSGGYWLCKGGDIRGYAVGYSMQVLNWQGKIVSERSISVDNAQYSPVFTVSWLSAATESALSANCVNLADYPLSQQMLWPLFHNTDKFVT
jgi:hypothetical protein